MPVTDARQKNVGLVQLLVYGNDVVSSQLGVSSNENWEASQRPECVWKTHKPPGCLRQQAQTCPNFWIRAWTTHLELWVGIAGYYLTTNPPNLARLRKPYYLDSSSAFLLPQCAAVVAGRGGPTSGPWSGRLAKSAGQAGHFRFAGWRGFLLLRYCRFSKVPKERFPKLRTLNSLDRLVMPPSAPR